MKEQRQKLILQLVNEEFIGTQESLQKALEKHGMNVTQATLSRDIRELSLIKSAIGTGEYKYSVPQLGREKLKKDSSSVLSLIADAVISVDYALNTVAVKCHTGMAQAVCAKLDKTGIENVVGTLAGDDTIFILMRTVQDADRLTRELNSIIAG
ncbi:MAG: arginine repressor [Ruminococcus sp.]|nr:arginine repressor [Ruminococcus sp.]